MTVTLNTLGSESIWVAWRHEDRGGKTTKVPLDPEGSGQRAKADDPRTWGMRVRAERAYTRLANGAGGGIGVEFAPVTEDLHLAGVDLDSCRDPSTGEIEPWAREVIDRFGSYAETSPSLTGAKIYFLYSLKDRAALRAAMGTQYGKAWKRGGGDHPPAIELHLGNRYFCVTDQHLEGTPETIEAVDAGTLLWLINDAGPRFKGEPERREQGNGTHASGDDNILSRARRAAGAVFDRLDGDGYGSRSEAAMALGAALKAAGWSYDDMVAALIAHPVTAEWAVEKGEVAGQREFHRIWERSEIPETKRPLHRASAPAAPFPVEAMRSLRPAAEAIHMISQAPMAICAQSVLAVATLAIQAHRDVEGPIGTRPLCGLFVSRAESGERKSAVDRLALRPVHEIEREWRDQADVEAGAFKNSKDAWDEARSAAKRTAKGNKSSLLKAFDEIGPEPTPPKSPVLLVSDATPEAIALHLADGRPFAGQFTAEGGLVMGGTGMSDENRMRAGAFYNTLWDGDAIRRNRAMARSAYLPGRRFTAHLMMQPNVASSLLADDVLTQLGTVARLLLVAPDTTAGTRLYREPPPSAWRALDDYSASIRSWLRRDLRTEGAGDGLAPEAMTLDADARALWIAFHDSVESSLGPSGALASIRSWGAKMPEHALRLAALLAAADDPETLFISRDAMADAITLAQHYGSEMLRLAGETSVAPDLKMAQTLLEWWQARPDPRCHLGAVYQVGPRGLRDARTARRIVTVLTDHGWLRPLPRGTVLDEQPRHEAWELVP